MRDLIRVFLTMVKIVVCLIQQEVLLEHLMAEWCGGCFGHLPMRASSL